ncbi:MAG: DUF3240 family protein [Roseateles sp.]|uniref:DUF3240 family protein n=1 Tax=Roseateles sp. TaxID=1971397 RepID=UPI004035DDBC
MSELCLNLLCPTVTAERAVDALLASGVAGIFTSTPTSAHGFAQGVLSTEEQVSGRGSATLVQVLIAADRLDELLVQLQLDLTRTGVRYWITPVIRQGEFQ